jgi:hypothetical protein
MDDVSLLGLSLEVTNSIARNEGDVGTGSDAGNLESIKTAGPKSWCVGLEGHRPTARVGQTRNNIYRFVR